MALEMIIPLDLGMMSQIYAIVSKSALISPGIDRRSMQACVGVNDAVAIGDYCGFDGCYRHGIKV